MGGGGFCFSVDGKNQQALGRPDLQFQASEPDWSVKDIGDLDLDLDQSSALSPNCVAAIECSKALWPGHILG